MPLVSIVIPSYQHDAYIGETIETALLQTYTDIEIIVIDDASTDSSWDVIKSFTSPNIVALRNDVNLGAHKTISRGICQANGDYIAILNSDDLYSPMRLQSIIPFMQQNNSSFCFTDVEWIDSNSNPLPDNSQRLQEYQKLHQWCESAPTSAWFLAGNLAVSTSNFVFSRDQLHHFTNLLPLRYTHDWYSIINIISEVKVTWLKQPLLKYRVHPSNTLSEDDHWRHIHENAFISALSLKKLSSSIQVQDPDLTLQADCPVYIDACLQNQSLSPLATLLALSCLSSNSPSLTTIWMQPLQLDQWFLQKFSAASGIPSKLFESLTNLRYLVDTLDWQAATLDQRLTTINMMSQKIEELKMTNVILADKLANSTLALEQLNADTASLKFLVRKLAIRLFITSRFAQLIGFTGLIKRCLRHYHLRSLHTDSRL